MRSAESINSKIGRVMASYKEANEKMNQSGGGLNGIKYTTFHAIKFRGEKFQLTLQKKNNISLNSHSLGFSCF